MNKENDNNNKEKQESINSLNLTILFNGYLSWLKEEIDGKEYMLPRIIETGNISSDIDKEHYSKYLFDKQGGAFTVSLDFRRAYFRARSVVLRSLWDYSFKWKKQFFKL